MPAFERSLPVAILDGGTGEVALTGKRARPLWRIRAERDPAAGVRNLEVPLPPPETARRLADTFSVLADALRGGV